MAFIPNPKLNEDLEFKKKSKNISSVPLLGTCNPFFQIASRFSDGY